MVDDIDRIDSDELFEVLRIIRVTANFPNIIFIVTYDREHVLAMLRARHIQDAEVYIKKIFQLELVLPDFEPYVLPHMLYEEIKNMTTEQAVLDNIWNSVFWKNHDEYGITRYIKNFRDVKRFASAFVMHISRMVAENTLNDIFVFDLFWLDVLAYYDFDTYRKLRDSHNDILANKDSNTYMLKDEYGKSDNEERLGLKPYTSIILQILFQSKSSVVDNTRIAVKDSYLMYFSYRVPDNKIGYSDFHKALMGLKEEIPAIVEKWCQEGLQSKRESLFSHIGISMHNLTRNGRIKNNYFIMLLTSVPYLEEFPVEEIFHSFLSGKAQDMIHDKCLDMLTQHITHSDHYMKWNKIIAQLYSYSVFDYDEEIERDKYRSIFTDDELDLLAHINWNNLVRKTGIPRVTDITKGNSEINRFMKDACVACCVNIVDSIEYRHSLVIDEILRSYANQYSPDFMDFIKPLDLSEDDGYADYMEDIKEGICTKIERLFGTTDKYKEFIHNTFTASDEDKYAYYHRIGI